MEASMIREDFVHENESIIGMASSLLVEVESTS